MLTSLCHQPRLINPGFFLGSISCLVSTAAIYGVDLPLSEKGWADKTT